jgi:RNA polymerase sigma-70 factor (ECF subfamily)
MNAANVAERVARESYGRLLALLTSRTRDVVAAEDALSEAFAAALSAWPRGGVPDNPEAWLFAAARRKLIDGSRRARTAMEGQAQVALNIEELEAEMSASSLPDRRLALMFACAHPSIDESVHTPLMLQTILGFSAERIASAFLIDPAAMSQRLVRAKKKIKETGVAFEIPLQEVWSARLSSVLEAIYAAYSAGWSDPFATDASRGGLADEAIWLGRVLVAQVRDDAEVRGLLALMLHLEARRSARRDASGAYVALEEQDVTVWRADLQAEAEALLLSASRMRRPGRFQLEAAIQSAHAARKRRGEADWAAIAILYEALAALTSSPVAHLNHAAALARRDGDEVGLGALEAARARFPDLTSYQPYWALLADLNANLSRKEAACAAYDEAIARERDQAVVQFLLRRRADIA